MSNTAVLFSTATNTLALSCATLGLKSASAFPCPYSKQKTSVAKLMEPGFPSSFTACAVPNPSASRWLASLIAAAQQTQQQTKNTTRIRKSQRLSLRRGSGALGSVPLPQAVLPRPVTARCCCTAVLQRSAALPAVPVTAVTSPRSPFDAASCSLLPSSDVQLPGFFCSLSCSLTFPLLCETAGEVGPSLGLVLYPPTAPSIALTCIVLVWLGFHCFQSR